MSIQHPSIQRAVVCSGQNRLSVITDAPVPQVTAGDVLISIRAVALNPADWKWLTNSNIPKAVIAGLDFAGTVVQVGQDVSRDIQVGDRVCGMFYRPALGSTSNGAFAEFFCASAELVIKIPDQMSFESAASLGTGISTAGLVIYQKLGLSLPTATRSYCLGETTQPHVLVYGASTASGTLITQCLTR